MVWDQFPPGTKENFVEQMGTMGALLTGQPYDNVPIQPFLMGYCAIAHGRPINEYYTNPEQAVAWQLDVARMTRSVPAMMNFYATYWCEDYGGTIRMPTGRMQAPGIVKHPAMSIEAAEKLEPLTAEELMSGPTMKIHMAGLKACEKYIGKDFTPFQLIYEPFAVGAHWVSPENMLMWVYNEPDLVHEIMRKVETHSINSCEAVYKAFGGKPFLSFVFTLLANSSTMSVENCKEFATDHLKSTLNQVMKVGPSSGVFYHQCGDHGQTFALCEDMPFPTGSMMQVCYDGTKPIDMAKVAKVYENKTAILGNIDPLLLIGGSPKEIYEAAYNQTMSCKHFKKGFISSIGCEMPPYITQANLQAYLSGSRDAGRMK